MAKGNSKLVNQVNEGITKLKTKGTFKEIEGRWLGGNTASETSDSETTTKQLS